VCLCVCVCVCVCVCDDAMAMARRLAKDQGVMCGMKLYY